MSMITSTSTRLTLRCSARAQRGSGFPVIATGHFRFRERQVARSDDIDEKHVELVAALIPDYAFTNKTGPSAGRLGFLEVEHLTAKRGYSFLPGV